METQEARIGARVRVREGYRKPELRGHVGTIEWVYGGPGCAAVEVAVADVPAYWVGVACRRGTASPDTVAGGP